MLCCKFPVGGRGHDVMFCHRKLGGGGGVQKYGEENTGAVVAR